MIIKYYFEDETGSFQECKASTMNILTNRLKQTTPNVPPSWVPIKVEILDLNEREVVRALRVFLTVSSNIGTVDHLIETDLIASRGDLLNFPAEPESGLYFRMDGEAEEDKVRFDNSNGSNYGNGLKLLNESDSPDPEETIANNEFKVFEIKFVPNNSQPNEKFFASIEAYGEVVPIEGGD